MPFDGNVWSDSKMVTYKEMLAALQDRCAGSTVKPLTPVKRLVERPLKTAKRHISKKSGTGSAQPKLCAGQCT